MTPSSTLVSLALRGSLLLGAAYLSVLLLPRASAALRRLVVVLGLLSGVALPLVALGVPGRPVARVVPAPGPVRVFAEALSLGAGEPGSQSFAVAPAERHSAGATFAGLAPWIWAAGALVVLARLVVGVAGAYRMARRAEERPNPIPPDKTPWPPVASSSEVSVPVVVGFVSPVVLLPVHAEGWSEERLRTVLMHEAAHVRRRDGLALLFASVALALYWFQPLAWLLLRRLRRECELAADEDVVFAGTRATTYAEHLLAVAREASVPAFLVAMALGPSELSERVRLLVSRERLPPRLTAPRVALASAVASLMLAFAACADAAQGSPAAPGSQAVVCGVDPGARAILAEEAGRAKAESGAARVVLVALEPSTGAVLAMADDNPGRPILPASTLKPLVVAAALDAGVITETARFDCAPRVYDSPVYGPRTLHDAAATYGVLGVGEIVAMSSNVGLSRIFDALGGERLARAFQRFHLDGAPAVIEDRSFDGAIVALGQRFPTTPLAIAAAYAALANDGRYVAPGLDRTRRLAEPAATEATARAVRRMLESAVSGDRATGRAARIAGVPVAGKTGTSDAAELAASFVGIVPVDHPRFVVLASVVGPKKDGTGATLAAPLFARVVKRLLAAR